MVQAPVLEAIGNVSSPVKPVLLQKYFYFSGILRNIRHWMINKTTPFWGAKLLVKKFRHMLVFNIKPNQDLIKPTNKKHIL